MDGSAAIRTPWDTPPAPGEAREVADGILWIRMPLPMKLDHVNCYALDDGDGWTLVDTGFASAKSREIWQALLDGPLSGKPVRRVLVTHHHPDHIGLAGWFQTEQGADLMTTRTAWLFARMLTLDVHTEVKPETEAFWRGAGMPPAMLQERLAEKPFNFADAVAPLPLGFTRIAEGDRLRVGARDWDVRIGNGHAPEHATLWSTDGEIVLGGDQLLATISPNLGVYATEPGADPVGEWLEACERLSAFATDRQLVLPGHKLPYTGLPIRMRQLIDNHHGALARLERFLTTPRTAVDCFPELFKRKIGTGEFGLALVEAVAHVNHLFLAGRVTRTRRDDGAWLYEARP
ncbi:MBL fold metallo-hydrolase [Anianabacter salinae]|uniref:MBL fold metallo-hydrolase n=1 Tax=Anianabacter salinae TaxID=2851023 RepID=UPI00225E059C|nr:MBL fold metallo-hydrolase [Anianabacter salinae]MBV0913258.1 MBL fold metallo-hydrolase [Anianabacter salinae]